MAQVITIKTKDESIRFIGWQVGQQRGKPVITMVPAGQWHVRPVRQATRHILYLTVDGSAVLTHEVKIRHGEQSWAVSWRTLSAERFDDIRDALLKMHNLDHRGEWRRWSWAAQGLTAA